MSINIFAFAENVIWNSMHINLFKVKMTIKPCHSIVCLSMSAYMRRVVHSRAHNFFNYPRPEKKLIDNLWKLLALEFLSSFRLNNFMIYGHIKSPDTSHVYGLMPRKWKTKSWSVQSRSDVFGWKGLCRALPTRSCDSTCRPSLRVYNEK